MKLSEFPEIPHLNVFRSNLVTKAIQLASALAVSLTVACGAPGVNRASYLPTVSAEHSNDLFYNLREAFDRLEYLEQRKVELGELMRSGEVGGEGMLELTEIDNEIDELESAYRLGVNSIKDRIGEVHVAEPNIDLSSLTLEDITSEIADLRVTQSQVAIRLNDLTSSMLLVTYHSRESSDLDNLQEALSLKFESEQLMANLNALINAYQARASFELDVDQEQIEADLETLREEFQYLMDLIQRTDTEISERFGQVNLLEIDSNLFQARIQLLRDISDEHYSQVESSEDDLDSVALLNEEYGQIFTERGRIYDEYIQLLERYNQNVELINAAIEPPQDLLSENEAIDVQIDQMISDIDDLDAQMQEVQMRIDALDSVIDATDDSNDQAMEVANEFMRLSNELVFFSSRLQQLDYQLRSRRRALQLEANDNESASLLEHYDQAIQDLEDFCRQNLSAEVITPLDVEPHEVDFLTANFNLANFDLPERLRFRPIQIEIGGIDYDIPVEEQHQYALGSIRPQGLPYHTEHEDGAVITTVNTSVFSILPGGSEFLTRLASEITAGHYGPEAEANAIESWVTDYLQYDNSGWVSSLENADDDFFGIEVTTSFLSIIIEKLGDCQAFAILTSSLLNARHIPHVFFDYPNHVTVAIEGRPQGDHNGLFRAFDKDYYLVEYGIDLYQIERVVDPLTQEVSEATPIYNRFGN